MMKPGKTWLKSGCSLLAVLLLLAGLLAFLCSAREAARAAPATADTDLYASALTAPDVPPETVTAWGDNSDGQCNVPPGNNYVAIAAGYNHSLALKSDGSLATWGYGGSGLTLVPAGNNFVAIAAGSDHSLALKSNGTLAAWGDNYFGQCNVPAGNNYVAIDAGTIHSLALRSDGTLAAWGSNYYGECNVPAGNDYKAIAGGSQFSLALKSDGSLAGWGDNFYGQTTVPAGNGYVAIAAGSEHSLALRRDGSLAAWGHDSYGQVSKAPAGNNYVAIAAGTYHSLALKSDGSLVAWGRNTNGQSNVPPGNNYVAIAAGGHYGLALKPASSLAGWGRNDYSQATGVPGNDYVAIAAGSTISLALRSDGSLVAWGDDYYGHVSRVPAGNDFVAIAAGGWHSLALRSNGSLVAWGDNVLYGQCDVPPGNNYVAIAAGGIHSLALKSDGSLVAWGNDSSGQVSNVPADPNYVAIAAGSDHNLALKSDGSLATWGYGGSGLTLVPAGNNYVAISAGFWYSLALRSDGSLVAWGNDSYGQVSNVPAGNNYVAIAAGRWHSLALRSNGSLVAWGRNTNGQSNVPAGNNYVAIAAGHYHSLALSMAYMVSASVTGGHGSVTEAFQNAGYGGTATINITPDHGYHIASITDNGVPQPLSNPYIISNVIKNHHVMVTFETTFYFAEGYTGSGFQEYLCLGNLGGTEAKAAITYLYEDGTTKPGEVTIPPDSRATVNVNAEAGADKEVSIMVTSQQQIVVERPMYFSYQGKWAGGHDVVGATSTSNTWYFAEGYTGMGFEQWVSVLNPGNTQANLTFRFQTQEKGEVIITAATAAPNSRTTFKVNDLLGNNYQNSLKLESDIPIVAERPMYFSYQGTRSWNWQGGHCVMGTTELSKEYYFAEGCTRNGFEEWLTLQNPHNEKITIQAVYQLGEGQANPSPKYYEVPGGSRRTIYIPDEVGGGNDVSVYLSSDQPFLAERPMYFNYKYTDISAQGGHCVIGAISPSSEWFLAEGYTGKNFNQWICIQNPHSEYATVEITYLTQEAGPLQARTITVPARTRRTVMVNDDAGQNYQLSTRVKVLSGPGVVVERPMYFIYNGWDGGHDVVGFTP